MHYNRKAFMRMNMRLIKELSGIVKLYDSFDNQFEIYKELAHRAMVQVHLRSMSYGK